MTLIRQIEEYLLNGKYRNRLIIYRKILLEKNTISENSSGLNELLDCELIIEDKNTYKISSTIYEEYFSKKWVESKLLPDTVHNVLKGLVTKTQTRTNTAEELLGILKEIIFNCPDDILNSSSIDLVRECVDRLVTKNVLDNWESGTEEAHLHLQSQANAIDGKQKLLNAFQEIINSKKGIAVDRPNQLQQRLLELELVVNDNTSLKIANYIYESAFTSDWIKNKLDNLDQSNNRIHIKKIVKKLPYILLFIFGLIMAYIFREPIINNNPQPSSEIPLAKILEALNNNYQEHKARTLALKSGFELKNNLENNQDRDTKQYSNPESIFALSKVKNTTFLKSRLHGFKAPIRILDFNHTGDKIAVGGEGNRLNIYQLSEQHKKFTNHSSSQINNINSTVYSLDFHPSNDILAVAEGSILKIFKSNGDRYYLSDSDTNGSTALKTIKFNRNGNYLFSLDDRGKLKLFGFNIQNGTISQISILNDLLNISNKIRYATFSSKSDILAFATDKKIFLYDLSNPSQKPQIKPIKNISSISISHDDKYILIVENHKIALYYINPDLSIKSLVNNNQHNVREARFIPWKVLNNYPFITIEPNNRQAKEQIVLWELSGDRLGNNLQVDNFKKVAPINKDREWDIEALTFFPNGNKYIIATGEKKPNNDSSSDLKFLAKNNLLLWDISRLVKKKENYINFGKNISTDKITIGRAIEHTLRLLTVNNNETLKVVEFPREIDKDINYDTRLPDKIIHLVVINNPDNKLPERDKLVVVEENKNLLLCPISREGCDNINLTIPFDNISLFKNSGNHIITIGEKGQSYFIKFEKNFTNYNTTEIKTSMIKDAEISSDGRFIVTLDKDNNITLRDWSNNKEPSINTQLGQGFDRNIKNFAFSHDSNYLAINNNSEFQLQKLVEKANSISTYETDIAVSKQLPQQISNFAFSPDSSYLAFVNGTRDNKIGLINLSNPDPGVIEFKPNQELSNIDTIIFSPSLTIKLDSIDKHLNLDLIVTAESNGKIRIWDFDGNEVAEFNSNHKHIDKLFFSPKRISRNRDEEYPDFLIAIEKDGDNNTIVQSWNMTKELNLDLLLQQGCEFLDKNLLSSRDVDEFSIKESISPKCDELNANLKKFN